MAPVSWSFTTGGASPPPLDSGPGGPVLVVKNSSAPESQFTPFAAEVLRAEGLNEFTTMNLSAVTASVLANFDVVVLGPHAADAAQISMFSTWVNGGGNLIAIPAGGRTGGPARPHRAGHHPDGRLPQGGHEPAAGSRHHRPDHPVAR